MLHCYVHTCTWQQKPTNKLLSNEARELTFVSVIISVHSIALAMTTHSADVGSGSGGGGGGGGGDGLSSDRGCTLLQAVQACNNVDTGPCGGPAAILPLLLLLDNDVLAHVGWIQREAPALQHLIDVFRPAKSQAVAQTAQHQPHLEVRFVRRRDCLLYTSPSPRDRG